MALVIPAGYYEAAFHHTQLATERPAVCTIGFHYTGSNFNSDVQFVALSWGQHIMQSMHAEMTFSDFTMRNQVGTVIELAQAVAGSTAHVPGTPNTAFLVKKITNQPGRFSRGRLFLPGVSEQDVDGGGLVVASKITEVDNNFSAFQADCELHQFAAVVLHNNAVHSPTTLVNFKTDRIAATQRRRMRK